MLRKNKNYKNNWRLIGTLSLPATSTNIFHDQKKTVHLVPNKTVLIEKDSNTTKK